jgi:hypothetical protein
MTTPKAIFLGLSLVAAAMLVVGLSSALRAAGPNETAIGTWQVAAAPGPTAWIVNTVTGELFACVGNLSCTRVKHE